MKPGQYIPISAGVITALLFNYYVQPGAYVAELRSEKHRHVTRYVAVLKRGIEQSHLHMSEQKLPADPFQSRI